MSTFEVSTEQFESGLVDGTLVVHLKSDALDIATQPMMNEDFYALLESVSDTPELLSYVQINSEYKSRGSIEELAELFATEAAPVRSAGFSGGYQQDLFAARFRNSVGRLLLSFMDLAVPSVAGLQGTISGDYLGMMLAFDSRVATADMTVSFDNARTGWPGSPGITHLLPRYIGIPKAMDLIHGGATIAAQEALELGLISEIVSTHEELAARCTHVAVDITPSHRHLVRLHRLQVLPSIDEMQRALERYYEDMAKSVRKLQRSSSRS